MKQVLKYLQLPDVMQHSDGSAVRRRAGRSAAQKFWPFCRAKCMASFRPIPPPSAR